MGPDPNTEMSLRQKTIEGVFWSGLARGGQHLSRLLATVLLVRLLMPEDFGLMAIAFIFMHFMMILGEMGLKPALIHGQDLNDLHYSSVFWLKVLVGTLLMLLTILAAPLIAGFYNRPDLEQILVVLSLNLVIVPLASVHQALLVKAMDFKTLAKPEIAATTLAGAAAIVAASMGLGIWSLVVQSLTFRGLTLCIVWALSDWRPRLVFSLQSLREVFPFGAYMTAHQLTDYGVRNVDQLLIGKLLGTVDLGFYTLAYKLMILPLQNISGVISGVAFPAFSRIHHDLERTRANYVKMVRVISQLSLPLMAGLFAAAPELVQLLFGPGWEPVVFLGRVFCFCGMLGSIGSTVHTIYQSQGRPDINAMFSLFFALPMTVLAVLVGLPYGINGIAICYALRTVLVIGLSHYIANRVIGLGWSQFTIAQRRGYVSALLVGLAMLFAGELGKAVIGPGTWLSLLLKAGVGFSVFMYLLLHSGLHMREAYAERFSKR